MKHVMKYNAVTTQYLGQQGVELESQSTADKGRNSRVDLVATNNARNYSMVSEPYHDAPKGID